MATLVKVWENSKQLWKHEPLFPSPWVSVFRPALFSHLPETFHPTLLPSFRPLCPSTAWWHQMWTPPEAFSLRTELFRLLVTRPMTSDSWFLFAYGASEDPLKLIHEVNWVSCSFKPRFCSFVFLWSVTGHEIPREKQASMYAVALAPQLSLLLLREPLHEVPDTNTTGKYLEVNKGR